MRPIGVLALDQILIGRISNGLGFLTRRAVVSLVKVLIFSDTMESILLEKADALSAPGGQVSRAESLHASVTRIMAPQIGIDPTKQPFWFHIRTEVFQDVLVHVLYGKVNLTEMVKIEQFNKKLVMTDTKGAAGRTDIAHRLRYMIPMACVLDSLERHLWPRP